MQLWAEEKDLNGSFEDIESLATHCRFKDCKHDSEPKCEVKKAIAAGDLDEKRFQNYLKLQKEIVFLESRQDQKLSSIEKAKWKKLDACYFGGFLLMF